MIPDIALKEWAAVCFAVALGRQTVLLRKGGLADHELDVPHERFWLFPTYYHTDRNPALQPGEACWLAIAERMRPAEGWIQLRTLVQVEDVTKLTTVGQAETYQVRHILDLDTVRQRFHYRVPGLTAITVRAATHSGPRLVRDDPDYTGCKSWVKLKENLEVHDVIPERACP